MANLITLPEYKTYAVINSTEGDARANAVISMVSSFVKTYCARNFADNTTTAVTEYSSSGGNLIYVKEPPITELVSVEQKITPAGGYTALTEFVDYEYDISTDCIYSLQLNGFPQTPNALKITYKGGFAEIPGDLKLGVINLVTYYLKNEAVPRKALNSNQVSTEYVQSKDLPPHIKRVFDLYRIIL